MIRQLSCIVNGSVIGEIVFGIMVGRTWRIRVVEVSKHSRDPSVHHHISPFALAFSSASARNYIGQHCSHFLADGVKLTIWKSSIALSVLTKVHGIMKASTKYK